MSLSNTATPIYYGRFRETVMRFKIQLFGFTRAMGELIRNPGDGLFCESGL